MWDNKCKKNKLAGNRQYYVYMFYFALPTFSRPNHKE